MAAPIAFEPPSIQKAWQAFLHHIPVVLLSWVGSIVLSLLAVLAYGLIIVAVSSIIGSSDAALGLGAVLANWFSCLSPSSPACCRCCWWPFLPSTTSAVRW